jgi:hypothetical protein
MTTRERPRLNRLDHEGVRHLISLAMLEEVDRDGRGERHNKGKVASPLEDAGNGDHHYAALSLKLVGIPCSSR